MASNPSTATFGRITGLFIDSVGDGADSDAFPDAIFMNGSALLTPSISALPFPTATPPMTATLRTIPVTIVNGVLMRNGVAGVWVISTDNESGAAVDWTWEISFPSLTADNLPVYLKSYSFKVPASIDTDLAVVAPSPSSTGRASATISTTVDSIARSQASSALQAAQKATQDAQSALSPSAASISDATVVGRALVTAASAVAAASAVFPSGVPASSLASSVQDLLQPNYRRIRRASALVRTDTTLTADDVLTMPVVANATYIVDVMGLYDAESTADIKLGLAVPSGTSLHGFYDGTTSGNAGTTMTDNGRGTKAVATTNATWGALGGIGSGTEVWFMIRATIVIGSTAGDVALMWAPNVAPTTNGTSLHLASEMSLTRVA